MKTTILLMGILLSSLVQAEVITLKVNNLGGESGQLALAIFNDPDAFPDRAASAIHTQFVPLNSGMNQVEVNINLKPGTYAIAAYLDKNKNRQLDTNMVGAPKERFGFSKNPKISFSAPNFNECAFNLEPSKSTDVLIKLIKFF